MAAVSMPSEEDIIKIMKSMLEKVLPSVSCSEVYVCGVAHDGGVLEGGIDNEPEDVQGEG
eukprot:9486072-Pyramimonas_sp.AAC.1